MHIDFFFNFLLLCKQLLKCLIMRFLDKTCMFVLPSSHLEYEKTLIVQELEMFWSLLTYARTLVFNQYCPSNVVRSTTS